MASRTFLFRICYFCAGFQLIMPGTRVRPPAGPSVTLVPGIHVFLYFREASRSWMAGDKPGRDAESPSRSTDSFYIRKRATFA